MRCAIVTISDTRTQDNDTGGNAIVELLESQKHPVLERTIVRDDPAAILATVNSLLENPQVQIVITTGGTGISSRDSTYEIVEKLLEKRLEGFGELFRMLSFEEIGASAMLSRASAGVARGKIIFSLPGSPHAVRLAMTRLILPELGHLVRELSR